MAKKRAVLAVGLSAATLALVLTNAVGGALLLQAGLAPVFGISAIFLSVGAFVLSLKQGSFLVAGLLASSGVIFMIPALIATGYFAVIVFPGPILGVIFGLGMFGLGLAKGIGSARGQEAMIGR
ncbi:MAG: hypothetical protein ACREAZ_07955 [Nitrososphaera sp.]